MRGRSPPVPGSAEGGARPVLVEGRDLACLVETTTGRVFQLHPVGAAMWPAACRDGSPAALVAAARARFDLPEDALVVAAWRLLGQWRKSGWLGRDRSPGPAPPSLDAPPPAPAPARARGPVAALCPLERAVGLRCEVPALREDLAALLAPAAASGRPAALIGVRAGGQGDFVVTVGVEPPRRTASLAGARWHVTRALVAASSRGGAPPFIIHGAAVADQAAAVVLPGASGAGKTTLAAALIAAGLRLLSDDIVPVDPTTGTTAAVRLAMACKAGSWEPLARLLPEFADMAGPPLHGGKVRYFWPPDGRRVAPGERPVVRLAILPSYRHGATAELTPLRADQLLAALGASGAVFPAAPERLAALLGWLEGVPAFALTYGDTAGAVAAVRARLAEVAV